MRTRRQFHRSVPIPANVPPAAVVAALLSLHPIVRHLGDMFRYEKIPTDIDVIIDDPWFVIPSEHPIVSWQLSQRLHMAPGLSREVQYPTFLQRVGDKVRGRADGTARVFVWTEFSVRKKPTYTNGAPATGADEYELYEEVIMECSTLLMPFIVTSTNEAHRKMCTGIVREVTENYLKGVATI